MKNEKLFIDWKNTEIIKFLNYVLPNTQDLNQDLTSPVNCQNDKHKIENHINPHVARLQILIYRQKTQETNNHKEMRVPIPISSMFE